jgi:hypothetical protein
MDPLIEYIPIADGETFPVFRNLWEFFAAKGNKTVFVSIGDSSSPMVELHLSETLGCKVHLFSDQTETQNKWNETKEILKTRKTSEATSEFAKQALKKWVLPQNILLSSSPFTFSSAKSSIVSICSNLSLEERIDILKIDTTTASLAESLYAILHLGYRPGLVLIHWETSPDSTLETTLLAGHLQNIGYGLVTKSKNNYLYYFTDKNLYEMCSWETNEVANPLAAKFLELIKNTEKE